MTVLNNQLRKFLKFNSQVSSASLSWLQPSKDPGASLWTRPPPQILGQRWQHEGRVGANICCFPELHYSQNAAGTALTVWDIYLSDSGWLSGLKYQCRQPHHKLYEEMDVDFSRIKGLVFFSKFHSLKYSVGFFKSFVFDGEKLLLRNAFYSQIWKYSHQNVNNYLEWWHFFPSCDFLLFPHFLQQIDNTMIIWKKIETNLW